MDQMIQGLGGIAFLALVFVIIYCHITWLTFFSHWDKPNDPNANFSYNMMISIDALFNHWSYWLKTDYLSSWDHTFYQLGIMFLYKIIIFKFVLSFQTDTLRACNSIIPQADTYVQLYYLVLMLESKRFGKGMRTSLEMYPENERSRDMNNFMDPYDVPRGYMRDDEWLNKDKTKDPDDLNIYVIQEKPEKTVEKEKVDKVWDARDRVSKKLAVLFDEIELLERKFDDEKLVNIIEMTNKE